MELKLCFVFPLGKGQNYENKNIKIQKEHKKCFKASEHQKCPSEISTKVIRTSKIKNINYLWRITYGHKGLWGVRLGSVRLG